MTYLDESIVQNEHGCCDVPSPGLTPEQHLSNVTNISHLRMSKAELPDNQRGVQDKSCHYNGKDESRNQT